MNSKDKSKDTHKVEAEAEDDPRERREAVEAESKQDDETSLTSHEQQQVGENLSLSAVTVYAVVRREGEEELSRPLSSLWWSGVAAGLGISASVVAEGVLHSQLEGYAYQSLVENLGYTLGFVLVILGRLQLFTENTITVVLPILAKPTRRKFLRGARLWSVVFSANMLGCLIAALLLLQIVSLGDGHLEGMFYIARHYVEIKGLDTLLLGVPAGFLIAALVWMLPSAKGTELFLIIIFTFLIAAGGFTHVIAGAVEVFLLVLTGELGLWPGIADHILPTLAGNILGGTGLFAILAYGQVHEEM